MSINEAGGPDNITEEVFQDLSEITEKAMDNRIL